MPKPLEGEPMDLEELLDLAEVSQVDIAAASVWWDENASPEWKGALD